MGLPWLGASLSRTFRGITAVSYTHLETAQLIVTTPYGDVLPSSKALAGAGGEMINMEDRQFLLKAALRQVADSYDFIFIDCPPSLEPVSYTHLIRASRAASSSSTRASRQGTCRSPAIRAARQRRSPATSS